MASFWCGVAAATADMFLDDPVFRRGPRTVLREEEAVVPVVAVVVVVFYRVLRVSKEILSVLNWASFPVWTVRGFGESAGFLTRIVRADWLLEFSHIFSRVVMEQDCYWGWM